MRYVKNKLFLFLVLGFMSACGSGKNNDTIMPPYPPAPEPPFRKDDRPTRLFSNASSNFICLTNENKPSEVKCWGDNSFAQVTGSGSASVSAPVTLVSGLPQKEVKTMAVGLTHACAAFNDNTVWCWGNNTLGQVDSNPDNSHFYAASQIGQTIFPDTTVLALTAGTSHTCAAFDDEEGTIWCWGNNTNGQVSGNGIGNLSSFFTNVTQNSKLPKSAVSALSAGHDFTCAAFENQSVWCWGNNAAGQVTGEPNHNYLFLDEGEETLMAREAVRVMGLPTGRVVNLSAGYDHACVNLEDGNIWCWGNDKNAQVSGIRNTLTATPGLTLVQGIPHDAHALTTGQYFTCAAFGDANLWCWGNNQNGAVDGSGTPGSVAQRITKLSAIHESVVLAAGSKHICASFPAGDVLCWGDDTKGQVNGTGKSGSENESVTPLEFDNLTEN